LTGFSGSLSRGGLQAGGAGRTFEGCRTLFRGHLADRRGVAARLGAAPGAAAEDVLALAYRRWGEALTRFVLGEYAAVVADEAAKTALLVHDALGLVPLFYSQRPGELVFATHLTELVGIVGTGELDEAYIADYLATGEIPGERTPYALIRRLLPGESLRWSPDRVVARSVWSLAQADVELPASERGYDERLLGLLHDAVGGAVAGGERAWAELSGGLDSSTVVSIAASAGRNPEAISFVYPRWPAADESRFMKAVAERWNVPHHSLDASVLLPFTEPPSGFFPEPTPSIYMGRLANARDELLASHGVDVLLTGIGGDQVFGADAGMPFHLGDALFSRRPWRALRDLPEWNARGARSMAHTIWHELLAPAIRHARGRQVWRAPSKDLPDWIDPAYRAAMALESRCAHRLAPRCETPSRQFVADELWNIGLNVSARGRRGARHETRHPLLFLPLVEFMSCVSWRYKIHPSGDRVLQRRALRDVLPEAVLRRRSKAGGTWALVEGIRTSSVWSELLCDRPEMVERGIADRDRWRLAVRQARMGQLHGDRFFMTAVALEAWLQQMRRARIAGPTSRGTNNGP
jgi:asparagine synthase (glutamine-hydrolysing)